VRFLPYDLNYVASNIKLHIIKFVAE